MGCGAASRPRGVPLGQTAIAMASLEEARMKSMQEALGGTWKFEVAPGDWQPFEQAVSVELCNAYYSGQTLMQYVSEAGSYEVDFSTCLQRDLQTGAQQRVAWEPSTVPDESAHVALGGVWQYEESLDVWRPFDADVSAELTVAFYCGEEQVGYETQYGFFEVDFTACVQTNRTTGEQQRIAWVSGAGDEEDQAFDYNDDCEQRFRAAFESGQRIVRYTANGCEYEVDFDRMIQTSLTTGEVWALEGQEADWQHQYRHEDCDAGATELSGRSNVYDQRPEIHDTRYSTAPGSNSHAHPAESEQGHDGQDRDDQTGSRVGSKGVGPHGAPTQADQGMKYHAGHQQYVPVEPKKAHKKYSLAPGARAQARVGPKAKPRARFPMDTPHGRPPSANASIPATGRPPEPAIKLPDAVEWPIDPKAKRVAEALFKDMQKTCRESLDARKRAFRAACLTWHPDKNPKHLDVATEVFKFLQALKSWYFS